MGRIFQFAPNPARLFLYEHSICLNFPISSSLFIGSRHLGRKFLFQHSTQTLLSSVGSSPIINLDARPDSSPHSLHDAPGRVARPDFEHAIVRSITSRIRTRAPRAAPRRMTPTGTSSFRLPMNGKWLHMAYSCLISDSSIIMTTERVLQWFALQPCQAPPPQQECRAMPTRLTNWASI